MVLSRRAINWSCSLLSKEVDAAETMIERTEQRFALKPQRLAGDVAYGTGEMLGRLVGRDIEPYIPVWDKSKRDDGSFSTADFIYDKARDVYRCPGAKLWKTTGNLHADNTYRYLASKHDCHGCALKPRCCPNTPSAESRALPTKRPATSPAP